MRMGVYGEYRARFLGSVADESHLSPIQVLVVDALGDDIGRDWLQLFYRRGKDGRVALHAAGIDHRADHPFVFRVLGVILSRHALKGGYSQQRTVEGVAHALGCADTNAQTRVAAGTGGDTHRVELCRDEAAPVEQLPDKGRQLRRVGIGLVGMEFHQYFILARQGNRTHRSGSFDK